MVGFRPADVPILELTPLSTIPSPFMHLRGTHFATLLFSSSSMEWGGGVYPLDVRTFTRFDAFPTYPLSFHILAHSFALGQSSTLLFSIDSALFAENHPGWGYPLAFRHSQSHCPTSPYQAAWGGGEWGEWGQTGSFRYSGVSNHCEPNESCQTNIRKRRVCPPVPGEALGVDEFAAFQPGQGFDGFAGLLLGEAQIVEISQIEP